MKGKTLADRQIRGAIGMVILAVFVYTARDVSRYVCSPGESAVSSQWEGSGITVELAGDQDHTGIYFLSRGATIRDLLGEAGVDDVSGFREADLAWVIHSGERVSCDPTRYRIIISEMSASTRLALGMPIDLNKATVENLVLVPGIGRKTASEIVKFREEKGDFPEVEALKQIKGLRKNKYDKIKEYLSINRASCS